MNSGFDSFEDLIVWQKSMRLCVNIYELFKHNKEFELRAQIQRSAISVPSNIAEGFERQTDKEFIRYLYMAKVRVESSGLSCISQSLFPRLTRKWEWRSSIGQNTSPACFKN